jgi:hypothetical protein
VPRDASFPPAGPNAALSSRGRTVHELTRDYLELAARCPQGLLPEEVAARLRGFHRFVEREGHCLARWPELLVPLALAQPQDSPVRDVALRREPRRRARPSRRTVTGCTTRKCGCRAASTSRRGTWRWPASIC